MKVQEERFEMKVAMKKFKIKKIQTEVYVCLRCGSDNIQLSVTEKKAEILCLDCKQKENI